MSNYRKKRTKPSISTGSMADIAFLMLIFFLVATSIDNQEGILVKLPPFDPDHSPIRINEKNVLKVLINSQDKILIRDQENTLTEVKSRVIEFISNPQQLADYPSSPKTAIISIQNDRATSYNSYLQVYNEITAAYEHLWNQYAITKYNQPYDHELSSIYKKEVRRAIPLVISEAEATDFKIE